MPTILNHALRRALLLVSIFLAASLTAVAAEALRTFDLPAGDAAQTLKQFSIQAGSEIVFAPTAVSAVKTNPVKGELAPTAALDALLADTGLIATQDAKSGAFAVRRDPNPNGPRVAQETDRDRPERAKIEDGQVVLDKFEVMGSKLLNMDLPRTRDDAQPYVIFDQATIEKSGASNLEDFLKNRLPMETSIGSESQSATSYYGSRSSINLRGLGPNQTLILVDGHRMAGSVTIDSPLQPDINGIPLGSIERIEILPTTASGIYGGGATGGVVNIVLRRDYVGADVKLTYTNSFDTDSAIRRVDVSSGFTLEGGKTNVLLAASYSDGNSLLEQDRDFLYNTRLQIDRNDPTRKFQPNPASSGTTNILSNNGQNLTLKTAFGGGALGSTITYVPYGYAGPNSDNGAGLIANAGQANFDLSNGQDSGSRFRGLINTPTIKSVSATIRRQFNSNFQAFVDLGLNQNFGHMRGAPPLTNVFVLQPSAPANPFDQPIRVAIPLVLTTPREETTVPSETRRAVAGAIMKLPGEWQVGGDYSYSDSRYSSTSPSGDYVTTDVSSGNYQVFRDLNLYPLDVSSRIRLFDNVSPVKSRLSDAVARAAGPLGRLPGGEPSVSLLLEQRKEVLEKALFNEYRIMPERHQTVGSAYAELKLPIVGRQNQIPLIQELDLQLAIRRDDYDTVGANAPQAEADIVYVTNKLTSTDPTIALRWVPQADFAFRASYGTGFLPPNITQLSTNDPLPYLGFYGLVDPKRGGATIGSGDTYFGGDPDLKPEHSETWSAGVVWTPKIVSGLRLSVDWVKLHKTDNIQASPSYQLIINYEEKFPSRVVRGPKLPGDPADWAGPITAVYGTAINIAQAQLEAYDFQLDYHRETESLGTFDFFAVGTKSTHFKTQVFPQDPLVERIGTSNGASLNYIGSVGNYPLKLKGNAGLTWRKGPWSAGWTARYFDSYLLADEGLVSAATIKVQGNGGRIQSQVFHDVFVGYRFGNIDSKLLQRTELTIGVKNVLNKYPVFDATTSYNGYSDPRLASYTLTLKKSF